eukprot:CAMPEP_0119353278 /NCGR_PEP_ID=MMETSP1334-20130426/2479_1 /TAXON_ID=127549 /ORGANISM="Calcidiscus leptoporus, Strain RCC1130" /LENGTH=511 /DNA_ID=CAMNT_0007366533 /DNA_START=106 /DNA_END=1641 /DNA_ORIENTATION=+
MGPDGEITRLEGALWEPMRAAPSWEDSVFTLAKPHLYGEYEDRRNACAGKWSAPRPLHEHTLAHMRANYTVKCPPKLPAGCDMGTPAGRLERFLQLVPKGPYMNVDPAQVPVRVCEQERSIDANGDIAQFFITRVGPLTITGTAGYKATAGGSFLDYSIVPAAPTGRTGAGTTFLVEFVDAYFDQDDKPIQYPPIHPHHSASFAAGFPPAIARLGETFTPFVPLTAYDFSVRHRQGRSAMLSPGFNADFVACQPDVDLNRCAFSKTPSGTGFPMYKGSDMWSNTVVNSVVEHMDKISITFEYGRKYVTRGPRSKGQSLKPLWQLDFSVIGDGLPYASMLDGSPSVAWHEYTMPFGGRLVGSWLHSHSGLTSECWVLDGPIASVLPARMLEACAKSGVCGTSVGTQHGTLTRDMPLHAFNLTATERRRIDDALGVRAFCHYRTRNQMVGGTPFGRSALQSRATARSCDSWTFSPGQKVSMYALNLQTPKARYPQHHRWTATALLDLGGIDTS